jgi:diguanylate cyclase (GGDEF)-like protein
MARERRQVVRYLVALDTAALGWAVAAVADWHGSRHDWAMLGLLAALAVAYEEGVRRLGRLRLRLRSEVHDMTAVWLVAAAVVLPASLIVLLAGAVFSHLWLRQQRPAGEPLYRKIAVAAGALLGCLAAHTVFQAVASRWEDAPWLLSGGLDVLVVLLVFTAVTRAAQAIGMLLAGVRGRALLGARDENLDEVATLCLGGLVAVAALREPWLCAFVLPPMVSLQRAALVRELETAATVDAKTGLLNAVAWEELGRRELARARRTGQPVAVLILDIDRFKQVNDRFGHLVGDDVLRRVGHCLQSSVREFDTVGRFGGEEFVVVLPCAAESEASIVAERLRSRINQLRISSRLGADSDRQDASMSVSIGVARAPADGTEITDLLLAADRALYAAKSRGRNCVVVADGSTG